MASRKPEGMSFYEWELVQAKEALSEILAMDRPGLRDNSYTILFLAQYVLNKVKRLTLQRGLDTPGSPPLSDSERQRATEAAGKIVQLFMVAEGVEISEAPPEPTAG